MEIQVSTSHKIPRIPEGWIVQVNKDFAFMVWRFSFQCIRLQQFQATLSPKMKMQRGQTTLIYFSHNYMANFPYLCFILLFVFRSTSIISFSQ